jgi:threonine/homoserine/homoserine lactone efflux protein
MMIDIAILPLFITTVAALVIIPGPNTIYIITTSVENGIKYGIISCLGVMTATLVHVFIAAIGLSAIILNSTLLFSIIKYIGAAYLIYLGIRTIVKKDKAVIINDGKKKSIFESYKKGVLVNLFNPKTGLFVAAFLPQFVDVNRGYIGTQIVILGILLVIIGSTSDLIYAVVAGKTGNILKGSGLFKRIGKYLTGSVYITLGIAAAFIGKKKL